ncbi:Retrovirus-related Pol polyprotein from transposon 17.6 [Nymphon striatum]|nr:Retrovirus-related Pol polyprotein from transposon 17.6 [Nymphon striatum]
MLIQHLCELIEEWKQDFQRQTKTLREGLDQLKGEAIANVLIIKTIVLTQVVDLKYTIESLFKFTSSENVRYGHMPDNRKKKIRRTEELDDATDVITKMENVTLMDGQVDTYVLSVRQAGGDQATDELVASSLLRQLSAEMRQSAILHTDSSLQSIVKHVKAYFKSRKMAPAIFGAISQPNPQSTHTVNNSDLMNQILTTQREQQQLLQVQTELLKTLTLGKNPRCYGCGELGHIRRNCPNTRYQGYRSGNNKFAAINKSSCLIINVRVNNFPLCAMIDTGASRTVISQNLISHLGIEMEPTQTVFQLPNSQSLVSAGKATVHIELSNHSRFHDVGCEVVTNLAVPFILGIDFLTATKVNQVPQLVCGVMTDWVKSSSLSTASDVDEEVSESAELQIKAEDYGYGYNDCSFKLPDVESAVASVLHDHTDVFAEGNGLGKVSVTINDAFPLPHIDSILDGLKGAKVFSSLDCVSGYWQVPVNQDSRALTAFCTPQGLFECLRSFLGFVGYLRRFLPNFSQMTAPLRLLLDSNALWSWGPEQQAALDISAGIGAILSQSSDEYRPIAFLSRTLSRAERNYSVLEKEMLAIVFALSKFRPYIYGMHFQIITDHRPLESLQNMKDSYGRVERWRLLLSDYDFEVVYRKGSENGGADGLSRSMLATFSVPGLADAQNIQQISADDIKINQQADPDLDFVIKQVCNGSINNRTEWDTPNLKLALATEDETALTTVTLLCEKVFPIFGIPNRILTDQGRNFESGLFHQMCTTLGIKKIRTTAYHPQGNGKCERANRTILSMLSKCGATNPHDWDLELHWQTFAYNTTDHASTKLSPYFVMFGRLPRLPVDFMYGEMFNSPPSLHEYVTDLRASMMDAKKMADSEVEKAQTRQRRNYDADNHVRANSVACGDSVSRTIDHKYPGPERKLLPKRDLHTVVGVRDTTITLENNQNIHKNKLRKAPASGTSVITDNVLLDAETPFADEDGYVYLVPVDAASRIVESTIGMGSTSRAGRVIRKPVRLDL